MKFEELKKRIISTCAKSLKYKHGRAVIKLVKIPIDSGIYRIQMTTSEKPGIKMTAGYLDVYDMFRFPTEALLRYGVEDGDTVEAIDPRVVVRDAIRSEALKIARQQAKVHLSDEELDKLYMFAEAWVFAGCKDGDNRYFNLGPTCHWMYLDPCRYTKPIMTDKTLTDYIQRDGVIDLLQDKPQWAKLAAQRWLKSKLHHTYSGEEPENGYTQLDLLRKDLTAAEQVMEYVEEIQNNHDNPVYDYIKMKTATARLAKKNVDVYYMLPDGTSGHGIIPAACFQYSPWIEDVTVISNPPHSTPAQRDMLKRFLPNGKAWLKKKYITKICYEGDVVWQYKAK